MKAKDIKDKWAVIEHPETGNMAWVEKTLVGNLKAREVEMSRRTDTIITNIENEEVILWFQEGDIVEVDGQLHKVVDGSGKELILNNRGSLNTGIDSIQRARRVQR